jgi:hypothetical protein
MTSAAVRRATPRGDDDVVDGTEAEGDVSAKAFVRNKEGALMRDHKGLSVAGLGVSLTAGTETFR